MEPGFKQPVLLAFSYNLRKKRRIGGTADPIYLVVVILIALGVFYGNLSFVDTVVSSDTVTVLHCASSNGRRDVVELLL